MRLKNKIKGIKLKINEPIVPDIVLLGLIFVNFLPPIVLPKTYPPISEKKHMLIMYIKKIGPWILYISYEILQNTKKI